MEGINEIRLKIIAKGYATKNDIKKFIPCGYIQAKEIFEEIKKETIDDGYKINGNSVLSKRLLKYVGLTMKDIQMFASHKL